MTDSTTQVVSRFRVLRAWLLTLAAALVIVVAMIVGLGRLALPYADHVRPWLEQALSDRLDQPVTIDRIEASWPRILPNVTLHGLGIGRDDARVAINQVLLEGRADRLLRGHRLPFDVVVLGLALELNQTQSGDWALQWEGGDALAQSTRLPTLPGGDVILRDARLMIEPAVGFALDLRISEAELLRQGSRLQLRGAVGPWLTRSTPLQFVLEGQVVQQQWQSVVGWLGTGDLFLTDWLLDQEAMPWWPADRLGSDAYVDAQVFFDWDRQRGSRLDGHFEAASSAGELSGRWAAERTRGRTQLDVLDLRRDQQALLEGLTLAQADEGWVFMADLLDWAGLHAMLDPWLSAWTYWPERVTGTVRAMTLALDAEYRVRHAEGVAENMGWQLPEPWPSLAGLTLTVSQRGDRLGVAPSGSPRLNWPSLIRAPIELDAIEGELRWAPHGLELVGLAVDSAVAAGRIDGWLVTDWDASARQPFMDLLIQVDRVTEVDPRPYLPHERIPAPAMQWLDQGLEWVKHARGEVLLHMPFGTKTADLSEAGFWADVRFSGARLRPWQGFPQAEAVQGEVQFVGPGLSGQVDRAEVDGVMLALPTIGITDLTEPELALTAVLSQAEASAVSAVLGAVPLPGWQDTFEPLRWSGLINSQADIRWPLRQPKALRMDGELAFLGTTLEWLPAGIQMPDLQGGLQFDEGGMRAVSVTAQTQPMAFELDWTPPLTLAVGAELEVSRWLMDDRLSALAARAFDGRSRWQLQRAPSVDGAEWVLRSDLQGTALHLPEPLDKPADLIQPLEARWRSGPHDDAEFSVTLGQAMALGWRRQREGQHWVLGVGQPQPDWPGVGGAHVSAALGRVAPAEWWLGAGAGSDWRWPELGFDDIVLNVEVAELVLPGVQAAPLAIAGRSTAQDLEITLDGPALRGSVQWPLDAAEGRALVADLDRLQLAPPRPMTPTWTTVPAPPSLFSGRHWPPITLAIDEIDWAGVPLGRLRWVSHPSTDGMELEVLDLQAPRQRLQARGRLQGDPSGEGVSTTLAGRVSGRGVSNVLIHAGYDVGIEAEHVGLGFDLAWPGAPWDFHLTRLQGTLDLAARNGRIPEARPGAGRLVGLASFNALPRRLTLDFRDVFGTGLQFDDIQGQFQLASGAASTDGVVINAPAAKITLRGDTDLVDRQYQQTIHVEPGLGSTLPVLGILAGGPLGAAAGLLLQTILDRPLREVAEVRYEVTGPWSDPQVALIAARVSDEDGETIVIDPDEIDLEMIDQDHNDDEWVPPTPP